MKFPKFIAPESIDPWSKRDLAVRLEKIGPRSQSVCVVWVVTTTFGVHVSKGGRPFEEQERFEFGSFPNARTKAASRVKAWMKKGFRVSAPGVPRPSRPKKTPRPSRASGSSRASVSAEVRILRKFAAERTTRKVTAAEESAVALLAAGLPKDVDHELAQRVYARAVEKTPWSLWCALPKARNAHVPALAESLAVHLDGDRVGGAGLSGSSLPALFVHGCCGDPQLFKRAARIVAPFWRGRSTNTLTYVDDDGIVDACRKALDPLLAQYPEGFGGRLATPLLRLYAHTAKRKHAAVLKKMVRDVLALDEDEPFVADHVKELATALGGAKATGLAAANRRLLERR